MRILRDSCIACVRFYRWIISPLFISLGVQCRFSPSCSSYAIEALERHGAMKGIRLSVWRLSRCHPFCMGGHDPVPPVGQLGKNNG